MKNIIYFKRNKPNLCLNYAFPFILYMDPHSEWGSTKPNECGSGSTSLDPEVDLDPDPQPWQLAKGVTKPEAENIIFTTFYIFHVYATNNCSFWTPAQGLWILYSIPGGKYILDSIYDYAPPPAKKSYQFILCHAPRFQYQNTNKTHPFIT